MHGVEIGVHAVNQHELVVAIFLRVVTAGALIDGHLAFFREHVGQQLANE